MSEFFNVLTNDISAMHECLPWTFQSVVDDAHCCRNRTNACIAVQILVILRLSKIRRRADLAEEATIRGIYVTPAIFPMKSTNITTISIPSHREMRLSCVSR